MEYDVFISYKKDNAGSNFATRLRTDLDNMGFSVYFNPDQNFGEIFPDEIKNAVKTCKDFILVLSQECLDQLKKNEKIDWVREEILTARDNNKHIIPIMMDGVHMPKDKEEMPKALQFLPDINGVDLPEIYDVSPLEKLVKSFKAKPEKDDIYRSTYNSNSEFDINITVKSLEEKVSNGDLEAEYELANLYYYGFYNGEDTSGRNFSKAYKYLTHLTSFENDYTKPAYSILGEMSYSGVLPRQSQSYEKALEYHRIASEKSGFSFREAAYMTSRGCGCEFSLDDTIDVYKKAADKGDTLAIMGLAKIYLLYGKFNEAAETLKKAKNNDVEALYNLGMIYRDGLLNDPPKQDFEKAAFYFQRAIETGKCTAKVYHELGRLYFTPTGDFPKDFFAAEKYFKLAADMGDKSAQYKLALIYEYGLTHKDFEKAIYYHTLSVKQGNMLSSYHLSMIYQETDYKNYHKAYYYAKQAAEKGIMEAEYILGMLLFYGRGCIADVDRSYEFFVRAFEHGMPQAEIMLKKIEELNQ